MLDLITGKAYFLTLSDGTTFNNLRANGTNLVSTIAISEDTFKDNLDHVVLSDGITEMAYDHLKLIQIAKYADGWYIALDEMSENELYRMKIQSDIEYLSMMSGIEL